MSWTQKRDVVNENVGRSEKKMEKIGKKMKIKEKNRKKCCEEEKEEKEEWYLKKEWI